MKISRVTPILTDDSPYPVTGKYRGAPMRDLPASYLDWLRDQSGILSAYPEVAEYLVRMKKVIDWELENE